RPAPAVRTTNVARVWLRLPCPRTAARRPRWASTDAARAVGGSLPVSRRDYACALGSARTGAWSPAARRHGARSPRQSRECHAVASRVSPPNLAFFDAFEVLLQLSSCLVDSGPYGVDGHLLNGGDLLARIAFDLEQDQRRAFGLV